MNDRETLQIPVIVNQILSETLAAGFQMASEPLTGSLLRTLTASKPSGYFLEIGTGTGIGTAWLLDGMDNHSKLITVENDRLVAAIAQKHLGQDSRVSFCLEDAAILIKRLLEQQQRFDLIFADTWIGKYTHLEETLSLLKPGSFYVIDDMLPQANWMEGHESNVNLLIENLENRQDLILTGGNALVARAFLRQFSGSGNPSARLSRYSTLVLTKLNWASGIVIATKK